jgi:hypothetical protein
MPEAHLIRCPHCNHALSLPEEFLGQVVTCLECRSPFRAPIRDGDKLTESLKLPKKTRIPARLFLPTFGLLLLGFVGLFLNAYLWWWFHNDPQGASQFAEANMVFMLETKPAPPTDKNKPDPKKKLTAEEQQRQIDESKKRIEEFGNAQEKSVKDVAKGVSADGMKRVRLIFGVISLGVVIGGFCFALRKAYYFCFLACFLSAINSPDLGCCFIGVIVGIWGFMMLISEEGRAYFRQATGTPTQNVG